jgi:MraZ protein
MDSLVGEYKITLDDKGRLSLPSRLRNVLPGNTQMLTKGLDGCLWLYPMEQWNIVRQKVRDSSSVFNSDSRALRRRLIGPAQDVEIDKTGRIAIPQSLREHADLIRDCIVLGQDDYIEIWNADRYWAYLNGSEDEYRTASERLGETLLREREQGIRNQGPMNKDEE